jgi:tRNA-dihydrouridine synthase B
MNRLESCEAQVEALSRWLGGLAEQHERLPYLADFGPQAANDDDNDDQEEHRKRLLA